MSEGTEQRENEVVREVTPEEEEKYNQEKEYEGFNRWHFNALLILYANHSLLDGDSREVKSGDRILLTHERPRDYFLRLSVATRIVVGFPWL